MREEKRQISDTDGSVEVLELLLYCDTDLFNKLGSRTEVERHAITILNVVCLTLNTLPGVFNIYCPT